MTNKEQTRQHAKEALRNRGLENYYNDADFNHYYRKHHCSFGNAFVNGLNISDFIIFQANIRLSTTTFNNNQIFLNHGTQS